MRNSKSSVNHCPVTYKEDTSTDSLSRYGGIVALKRSWQQMGAELILKRANIRYSREEGKVNDMSFLLVSAPFLSATSQRQVAQRFGGESSEQEGDELLGQQVASSISQRTLNRFTNTERFDWLAVQAQRIAQLQRLPCHRTNRKGVVIVDDWPLLKPYAEAMPYLSPVWDNNLKCSLKGYAIVHLYYYHPRLRSYSLGMYPWLKTSLTGERKSKGKARRPARADEEMSKLDIALMLIKRLLVGLNFAALVFDSWYTVRWLGHELTQEGQRWIGDSGANQKFEVNGCYLSVPEIYQQFRHRLCRVPGTKRSVRAFGLQAKIRPDPYTKVAQPVQLVLVTGLHKPRDNDKGYKLLVCNQSHWRVGRIIRLFSYRPQIEQAHRHGKQIAGWVDFHARSVPALLCHLTFCSFRCDLLALVQLWTPATAGFSPGQVVNLIIQAVVRLTRENPTTWVPLLKVNHPLWSFIDRTTFRFY